MKKMILSVVVVMSLIGGKAFAGEDEKVNSRAKEAFSKEFPAAEFAKWEEIENGEFYLVRFYYDQQGFVAYYNTQGQMIATARLVTRESLPLRVSQVMKKMHNESDILKIEELTMEGTLSYFVTVENDAARILLRIYHDGTVHKIKEEKKKSVSKKKGY